MRSLVSVLFGALLVAWASNAQALPVSSCTSNSPNAGVTCNFYESLADGTPSSISNIVNLNTGVTPGYIVLMDSGNPASVTDRQNVSLWSDVLQFIFDPGLGFAATAQLFSKECGCLPTYATVTAGSFFFTLESAVSPTVLNASPNTYNVFEEKAIAGVASTPEPASLLLLASGLAGVAARARRRRA